MATRWAWVTVLASAIGGGALAGTACGGNDAKPRDVGSDGGDASVDASQERSFGGGEEAGVELTITPDNPSLDVPGSGLTVQFKATLPGSSDPVEAIWSTDFPQLGQIDKNGLFTASGEYGGRARITATAGKSTGSTMLHVKVHISENPGGIDPGTQAALRAGGGADPSFTWLYPYDQTVFPRGLPAPALQFDGDDPSAFLVKITSAGLEYEGFYGGNSPSSLQFSENVWKIVTYSARGTSEPVHVEVTKSSGGGIAGPITEDWMMAPGTLRGAVYYNSYDSPLSNREGAVLRVKPGEDAEVLSKNCTVCHSVSADGSTLVTARNGSSVAIDLRDGWSDISTGPDHEFTFTGVYPDGSLFMTTAAGTIPGPPSATVSRLYDTQSGSVLPASGWDGVVTTALMPAFSPDGKKIAFNNYTGSDQGHTISVMDFDRGSLAFSNLTDIVQDGSTYLGWPAFLPDGNAVLFHTDSSSDFATWNGAKANLSWVDIPTSTATPLDLLNGVRDGDTYLPYGTADTNQNYEPTVLPIAVGGYYWVVFTSRRYYGNTITPANKVPTKKLWIAAIDVQTSPGNDPSHPAFYLQGQELAAGNMRGFWALDPCKQNSETCESGDECCNGFCRQTSGGNGKPVYTCVPPEGCAQEYEKCTTSADCCDQAQGVMCINGHCARNNPN